MQESLREINNETDHQWQDHYGPTIEEEILEMHSNIIEDNLIQWVDDQKLDEKIIIEDVK